MDKRHIAIKEMPVFTVTVNGRTMTVTDGAVADDNRVSSMGELIDEMMNLIRGEVVVALHKTLREKTGFNGPTTPTHIEKVFRQFKKDCQRAMEERRVEAIMMKEEQL